MRLTTAILGVVSILAGSHAFSAEERIVNLVTCTLNEGKTQNDVQQANGRWVRYMNENVPGGGIRSAPATSIVGDWTTFLYIDSFPSLESWSAMVKEEQKGTGEIQEILDALNEAVTCTENNLYRAIESG